MKVLFHFESADSLAQFGVWLVPLLGGSVLASLLGSWTAMFMLAIAIVVLVVGLRASITVSEQRTVIVKKWFFVPYRRYTAPEIDDVWFGGDWGLEDGASGVVVKLGDKEVHIGTARNMRKLHDALMPLTAGHRARAAAMEPQPPGQASGA